MPASQQVRLRSRAETLVRCPSTIDPATPWPDWPTGRRSTRLARACLATLAKRFLDDPVNNCLTVQRQRVAGRDLEPALDTRSWRSRPDSVVAQRRIQAALVEDGRTQFAHHCAEVVHFLAQFLACPFHQVLAAPSLVVPVEAQHATVEHQADGSESLYRAVVQVGRDAGPSSFGHPHCAVEQRAAAPLRVHQVAVDAGQAGDALVDQLLQSRGCPVERQLRVRKRPCITPGSTRPQAPWSASASHPAPGRRRAPLPGAGWPP